MPNVLRRAILSRHRTSLQGNLRDVAIFSTQLCSFKHVYVYEPAALETTHQVPVVYLFRGHEREWVNIDEDTSRKSSTAIEDVDFLITKGVLPPMILVMPGLNSTNNHIPSLGINMQGRWSFKHRGLGTGRFWSFLTRELFPYIERKYPTTQKGKRMAVGFSLGGFTASLLGLQFPAYFDHIGIYDGLFMWPQFLDPRNEPTMPFNDTVWLENPLFDASLGKPRKQKALKKWNPTDTLTQADPSLIKQLQKTTWWITSAPGDGNKGNYERTKGIVELFKTLHIPLGFDFIVLDDKAAHNWHWTDRFLFRFLQETLP